MTIETASAADGQWLEAALLRDLAAMQPQGSNDTIRLVLRNGHGRITAGLTGAMSYGWLLIKVLWVAPDQRRSGVGTALVRHACTQAQQNVCHAVWLDTSNADARSFYDRLGFAPFGQLANRPDQRPPAHCRWFLRADIADILAP